MPTETHNMGRTVLCDWCNQDWTDDEMTGGFIFGSYATCPDCAPRMTQTIRRNNEQHRIHASCPLHQSFADFVREYRGGDGVVTVTSIKNLEELNAFRNKKETE